jgi:DNA-binding NarL/FixJ family response regulator
MRFRSSGLTLVMGSHKGGCRMAPIGTTNAGGRATTSAPLHGLTPREKEILRGLAGGLSDLQIANKLLLYEATVKNHVRHILRKLRMTRAEVVAYAIGNDDELRTATGSRADWREAEGNV